MDHHRSPSRARDHHLHRGLAENLRHRSKSRISVSRQSSRKRVGLRKSRAAKLAETHTRIFNDRLDALVCAVFLFLVTVIIADSLRVWFSFLTSGRQAFTPELAAERV